MSLAREQEGGKGTASTPQASETCSQARKDQKRPVTGAASPKGRDVDCLPDRPPDRP